MLQVRALFKLKFWIFPLITYFRYHVTEYCAVIVTHSTVRGNKLIYGQIPDPFPRCGIGSGHARLWVYVVGTDEFRWSHAFCLVFALTVPSIMYFSLNMESVELVKGDSLVYIPIEARWDPVQKGCNLYLHKRTGRWWRDTLRGYTASGLAVYPHP